MPTTWTKAAGVPVFPPHDDPDGACVLRDVHDAAPWRAEIAWPEGFEGGIVHRLDTSTSGALLLADAVDELAVLRDAFASGALRKRYLLRAARDVPWHTHVVDVPLAHDRRHKRRMVAQRGPATPHRGKWYPAHTELRRVDGALWEAVITTGVMHQIRVHCAFVGLPLAGDRVYGGGATPADAPPGAVFLLHHVGLDGPGVATAPVPAPAWAAPAEGAR
ncbi:MAG: RNA pseudouridine synthase [Alphaproteobacteria bacterium]|nr:RNA pseudouridine synthase [Alphaproteobacteria bacterium]